MKIIKIFAMMFFVLFAISACGGGGAAGGGVVTQVPKTAVTLKVDLSGTLPANTAISGTAFTLNLPADVTPLLTNNVVDDSVVAVSGTFAGGTLMPPVYTAATANTPGNLKIIAVNAVPAGVTSVGEVATVVLQLANGATPSAADFILTGISVIDASQFNTINNMEAVISSISLQ